MVSGSQPRWYLSKLPGDLRFRHLCLRYHEERAAGILDDSYFVYGKKAFDGICKKYLSEENGELQLGGICLVAGLGNKEMREGTFDYYMREPVVKNEAMGVAPLILAYVEVLMAEA